METQARLRCTVTKNTVLKLALCPVETLNKSLKKLNMCCNIDECGTLRVVNTNTKLKVKPFSPLCMILDTEIGIFVDVFCFLKITTHISTYYVSTPNKNGHSCSTVDSRVFYNSNLSSQSIIQVPEAVIPAVLVLLL